MSETKGEDVTPPMSPEERKDFTGKLFKKLAFVRGVGALGKDVSAAVQTVAEQIHDTITKGDPKKG